MMYKWTEEYFACYDHYERKFKKYDRDYVFGSIMRFAVIEPENTMKNHLNLPDYTLVRVVMPRSIEQAFYMKGKMYIESGVAGSQKALVEWLARNVSKDVDGIQQFTGGPVMTIQEADFLQYDRYNYKNEKV